MFDLEGKAALVTGASGGIGGAIARALHAQGAAVALSGTRKEALDAVAGELGVSIHGRHTALGDSLVTAEIFASLLPRLADQGITTLGHATAFSRRAKGLIQAQAKAGW